MRVRLKPVATRRRSLLLSSALLIAAAAHGPMASAAVCTAVSSGNWNFAGRWDCGHVPGTAGNTGDEVVVPTNFDVTQNTSPLTIARLTINAAGATANNTTSVIVGANTLNVTGDVDLIGHGTTASRTAMLSISTGTVNAGGSVTVNNARSRVQFSSNGTLNVGMNFDSGGTLLPSTGRVRYNTASAGAVGNYTYTNLSIDKGAGTATASGAFTVNGTLTVESGTLDKTAGGNVTIANLAVQTGGTFTAGGTGNVTVNTSLLVESGGLLDIAHSGTLTVNAASTVTGELRISATGGTKTFGGNVTITDPTGKWNNTGNIDVTMSGDVTNNNSTLATSFVSGTGTYTHTSNGETFSGAGGLVFAGDVAINGTRTNNTMVEVKGNLTGSSTLTNNTDSILRIGGNANGLAALIATAAGNTVDYNGTAAQVMKNTTYRNLTISNTTGPVTTPGNINIQGDLVNNGNFDALANNPVVTFNGAAAQKISGTAAGSATPGLTTFHQLVVNNAAGLTLDGTHNVTVINALTLSAGAVATGGNILHFSNNAATTIARTSGFVEGNLKWALPTGAVTRTFPVGTGTAYSPATLAFGTVATGGDLTVSATGTDHASLGSSDISPALSVNRYWTVAKDSAFAFDSYDATFQYVAGDSDPGITAALLVVERYDGSAWNGTSLTNNSHTAATPSVTIGGEADLGAFAIGELAAGNGYSNTLGRFNAYDPPNITPSGSVHGLIRTKTVGTPFTLTIVHLTAGGALSNLGFNATITVAIIDAASPTGTFDAATNCYPSWLSATPVASVTIAASSNQNTWTTPDITVPDAYKDLRVRVTIGAFRRGCSGDLFAARPASFGITASDATSSTPGTANTLNATTYNGTPVHKAGLPFSVRVISTVPPGATNYYQAAANAGNPVLRSAACVNPTGSHPTYGSCSLACTPGALALGGFSVSAGELNATATYAEAGAVSLTFEDRTYANVDRADTAQAVRTVPQTAPVTAGRFIPNDLVLTANNPPLAPAQFQTFGLDEASCNTAVASPRRSFTYVGQSFGYAAAPQVLVTARNGLASPTTTKNYQQCLWHLDPGGVTITPSTSNAGKTLNSSLSAPGVAPQNDGSGTGTVTLSSSDSYSYARSTTTPDAAFNALINLAVSATDTDGAPSNATLNMTSIPFDSGSELRYGRLRLGNANGPQFTPLLVPLEAQYWNGTSFITNAADHCTAIGASNIELDDYRPNLAACETSLTVSALANGRSGILMSPAGKGNDGSVRLTARLDAAVSGTTCIPPATSTPVSGANRPYLQGNWTTTTFTQNPTGRATFGVYQGSKEVIHLRENFSP